MADSLGLVAQGALLDARVVGAGDAAHVRAFEGDGVSELGSADCTGKTHHNFDVFAGKNAEFQEEVVCKREANHFGRSLYIGLRCLVSYNMVTITNGNFMRKIIQVKSFTLDRCVDEEEVTITYGNFMLTFCFSIVRVPVLGHPTMGLIQVPKIRIQSQFEVTFVEQHDVNFLVGGLLVIG